MARVIDHPFHEGPLVDIVKSTVVTHRVGELIIDPKSEAWSKAFLIGELGNQLDLFNGTYYLAENAFMAMASKYGLTHIKTIRILVRWAGFITEIGESELSEKLGSDVLSALPAVFPDEEQRTTKTALAMAYYRDGKLDEAGDMLLDVEESNVSILRR
ncbi:hypothetical protein F5Y11DRAFT_344720 [Daldinia sp. FL1419]|nr:hypothetical protein F5Y11DRAFT_344720 [Daldinia sp. FL1419]